MGITITKMRVKLHTFMSILGWFQNGVNDEDTWQWRRNLDILEQGGSLVPDPGLVADKEYLQNCILEYYGSFKNVKVLGAGCGTGRIEAWLASEGADVYCLDNLVEALKISRIHAQRLQSNDHCVLGDLKSMPFKEKSFHVIYSGGVLEHLNTLQEPLNEYFRVTQPGGVIVVSVPNLVGINALFGVKPLIELVYRKKPRNNYIEHDFTARKFRKAIEEAGFICSDISPAFFNTFDYFPFKHLRKVLNILRIYGLCQKALNVFGRKYPGIAFGYSFMIALGQRPKIV
jgi:2-polyprenyl-3-methyl-5-hydroxy-6-metoxy-1,4-benzoquinol methylase